MAKPLVLVTGATGFIAAHIVVQLLQRNFRVRATVRDPESAKSEELVDAVAGQNVDTSQLELVAADLLKTKPEEWASIVQGCQYVLHTASPFVLSVADVQRDLIDPAVNGTTAVLEACAVHKEQIENVVVTSSIVAVMSGHSKKEISENVLDHTWYTSTDNAKGYNLSKALAEEAAWRVADEAGMPMCTVNPGLVVGPMLMKAHESASSHQILRDFFAYKSVVHLGMPMVDVRDVATLHIEAMLKVTPAIERQRYLALAHNGRKSQIADVGIISNDILVKKSYYSGYRLPIPNWMVSCVAGALSWVAPDIDTALLGVTVEMDDKLTREGLNQRPGSLEWALYGYLMSAMHFGLMKTKNYPQLEVDGYRAYPHKDEAASQLQAIGSTTRTGLNLVQDDMNICTR